MNKHIFLEEMLDEVKNIKDLAKEELPLVAKEYIKANLILSWIGVAIGTILLLFTASVVYYFSFNTIENRDLEAGLKFMSLLSGIASLFFLGFNIANLINFHLQPRRMAIVAITSLKD